VRTPDPPRSVGGNSVLNNRSRSGAPSSSDGSEETASPEEDEDEDEEDPLLVAVVAVVVRAPSFAPHTVVVDNDANAKTNAHVSTVNSRGVIHPTPRRRRALGASERIVRPSRKAVETNGVLSATRRARAVDA
jgi:hypothetical protein